MKSYPQQPDPAPTPGIFQPVFSGSSYAQHFPPVGPRVSPLTRPAKHSRRLASPGSGYKQGARRAASSAARYAADFTRPAPGKPALGVDAFEPSYSLFAGGAPGGELPPESWSIFGGPADSTGAPLPSPELASVNLDFANEFNAEGLADSLLNTAAAVAAQPVVPAFSVPPILDSELVPDSGGGGSGKGRDAWAGSMTGGAPSDSSSTASSTPVATSFARLPRDEHVVNRPALSEAMIEELNDVTEFRKDDRYQQHIVPYREKISFPIGEGGRELLRACLNVRGCKGRQLQGASVPVLLQLAHQWNLWDVALRIKIERQTGQLSPSHEAFVRFKATQSQLRKYVRKEYMVTERDQSGKIARIHYDENRKIKLGKDGRESLRAKLRRLHDKHANRMDELLAQHGFKYSELRNATVQQLGRMAFVCNLWDQVISACRSQEEKRDGRGYKARAEGQIKLPASLAADLPKTDENGEMSNDDARRTMAAVSALLQQSYDDTLGGSQPDVFSSAAFTGAFAEFPEGSSLPASTLVDVKQEPTDQDDESPSAVVETPSESDNNPAYMSLDHLMPPPLPESHQPDVHYSHFDPTTGGFF